jgi:hypothetical protein
MVFMPPRHGKSELDSRYFPAWFLGLFPDRRVILASYEASFAASWGRKARDVLEEHGAGLFGGVKVRRDSAQFRAVCPDVAIIVIFKAGTLAGKFSQ